MAAYSINNALSGTPQNLSTLYKTIASTSVASGAPFRRSRVYDLMLGTAGTPADNVVLWDLSRMTAAGTGTLIVPQPIDPAEPAAINLGTVNYTVEPTVTPNSNLLNFAANQRATYRWVCDPSSDQTLLVPAVANNGIVVRAQSPAYTGTVTVSMFYRE